LTPMTTALPFSLVSLFFPLPFGYEKEVSPTIIPDFGSIMLSAITLTN